MKRFQVSMRPEIYEALEKFRNDHFSPERSAIIDKAIERFLIEQGYYEPPNGEA